MGGFYRGFGCLPRVIADFLSVSVLAPRGMGTGRLQRWRVLRRFPPSILVRRDGSIRAVAIILERHVLARGCSASERRGEEKGGGGKGIVRAEGPPASVRRASFSPLITAIMNRSTTPTFRVLRRSPCSPEPLLLVRGLGPGIHIRKLTMPLTSRVMSFSGVSATLTLTGL